MDLQWVSNPVYSNCMVASDKNSITFVYYFHLSAGFDYGGIAGRQLIFGPAISTREVQVSIEDDNFLEISPEYFTANLTSTVPRLILLPDEATVSIVDNENDSKCMKQRATTSHVCDFVPCLTAAVIGFNMTLYDVTESEGQAMVYIVLHSSILLKQVTVNIFIMDGSASSEYDSLYNMIKSSYNAHTCS